MDACLLLEGSGKFMRCVQRASLARRTHWWLAKAAMWLSLCLHASLPLAALLPDMVMHSICSEYEYAPKPPCSACDED